MSGKKTPVVFEIKEDSDILLDQIVAKYGLPDKSKALRCLLSYMEEKEDQWADMFETVRCPCGQPTLNNYLRVVVPLGTGGTQVPARCPRWNDVPRIVVVLAG